MLRAYSGEATHINFIVFGLTRLGLEPTIYCTRGEHANHYTTDAVDSEGNLKLQSKCILQKCSINMFCIC
jgi:hypothetical protein